MKQYFTFDENGFFESVIFIQGNQTPPENSTDILPSHSDGKSLYRPKFINGKWIEGATQEYIDSINKPVEQRPSEIDVLRKQLTLLQQQNNKMMDIITRLQERDNS